MVWEIFKKLVWITGLVVLIIGCRGLTKQEHDAINNLNQHFQGEYVFEAGTDLVGVNLKVRLQSPRVDSVALKQVFDSSIVKYRDHNNISWEYLHVHNQEGNYLFSISKYEINSQQYNFFSSGED